MNSYITDGVPTIYGYTPLSYLPGEYISSDDEFKNDAFNAIIGSIGKMENPNISSVTMADEHDIIVNYKNGMVFNMGNWSDADYKFSLAETVMEQPSVKGKKGSLTMIGSKQMSFRTIKNTTSKSKKDKDKKQSVDSTGKPITTEPEPSGEQNPEQDALFSDYNNRDNTGEDYFNWENETTTEAEQVTDVDGGYYDEYGIYHDQYGGYMDSWGNYHDQYGGYYDANRRRDYDEILPWDHLDYGITKEFLIRENEKAKNSETTSHCRIKCAACGASALNGGECGAKC